MKLESEVRGESDDGGGGEREEGEDHGSGGGEGERGGVKCRRSEKEVE